MILAIAFWIAGISTTCHFTLSGLLRVTVSVKCKTGSEEYANDDVYARDEPHLHKNDSMVCSAISRLIRQATRRALSRCAHQLKVIVIMLVLAIAT